MIVVVDFTIDYDPNDCTYKLTVDSCKNTTGKCKGIPPKDLSEMLECIKGEVENLGRGKFSGEYDTKNFDFAITEAHVSM